MKVSNEAARQQSRTNGQRSEDPERAEQLFDTAERWADAMEPALDQGANVASIAIEAFLSTVPPSVATLFDHPNDFMVDYLEDCWRYGHELQAWYDNTRPVPRPLDGGEK